MTTLEQFLVGRLRAALYHLELEDPERAGDSIRMALSEVKRINAKREELINRERDRLSQMGIDV
jgi:hypothetical protein